MEGGGGRGGSRRAGGGRSSRLSLRSAEGLVAERFLVFRVMVAFFPASSLRFSVARGKTPFKCNRGDVCEGRLSLGKLKGQGRRIG